MIEVSQELSIATKIRQIGTAASELMGTISESRANYWASYVTDFSCPILFAYLGAHHGLGWTGIIVSTVAGLLTFSLIEYAIHRWMLHNPKNVLYPLHEAHHNHPETPSAFLFPTSLVVLGLVWLCVAYAFRLPSASFFIAGVAAGYCCFGTLHHLEHTTRINQIPFRWLQTRWAAHSVHHRLDQSNFGVTTSLWDWVFGTSQKQVKRRQSQA